ncbi:sensor histidine kinase [Marilutibacter chinensis]|uniref:Histidine kinase n=1 Tax=Marilutibacter chinensis TaxID=2912247 RepID=A0ABS9HNP8_9GAMM|nr:histidine kinase [Lysobacter chinensis]MCF7220615.1 histidine kinase [Lysobacter chinensis]
MAIAIPHPLGLSHKQLFWILHLGGWLAYLGLGYLSALAYGKPGGYAMVYLATGATGAATTLGLRYLLRACRGRPPALQLAIMVLPILASSALMERAGRHLKLEFCPDCSPENTLTAFFYALSNIYVVLAWVGLYLGITYYRQSQDETRRALAARTMAHQAQLKMLRYQLNPHFLFNTLNAISTLVLDRDNANANRMVQSLSAFLRHSLDSDPMQRVTLRQEMDALTLYLDIEKVRFAERLQVETEIDEDCWRALLPSLLLQPLVENAIKYAVARQVEGGLLRIEARRDGDRLVLTVTDNGPGCLALEGDTLPAGNGVGLRNTRERLRVLYGEAGTLCARNLRHGLEVRLQLPFETSATSERGLVRTDR